MQLIDRYVAGRFLTRLLGALIAGAVIFIVVDNVENLDKFIDARLSVKRVVIFYILYLPYIFYLVLPVGALLATLFNIGGLAAHRELTALRAVGVPFYRIALVNGGVAVLWAALAFIIGETIVPVANRKRLDIYRYEVKRIPKETRTYLGRFYFQLPSIGHLYIDRYISTTKEAYGVELVQVEGGRVLRRMEWEKMAWRDRKWVAQGVVERVFGSNPDGSLTFIGDTVMALPGVTPDELEKVQVSPEEMNFQELRRFIDRLRRSGGETHKWEVERYFKVAMPSATVIIVLFGAPLAAIRWKGGGVLAFGLALLVCFIYYGLLQVSKVLGYTGNLPPAISAWSVNLLFLLIGAGLLRKVR